MSLNYNIGNVKDYRKLKDSDGRLNVVTETLVFSTMSVDIGSIEEKNIGEWCWRLAYLRAMGLGREIPLNDEGKRDITLDELRRHIGMRTNVITTSRAEFCKRWSAYLRREADAAVRYGIYKDAPESKRPIRRVRA